MYEHITCIRCHRINKCDKILLTKLQKMIIRMFFFFIFLSYTNFAVCFVAYFMFYALLHKYLNMFMRMNEFFFSFYPIHIDTYE